MSDLPQRKSPRLAQYDYSQDGLYFVTICVQNRAVLFGNVRGDVMERNEAGEMVAHWWSETSVKFRGIELSDFVVMPNHFHGIVLIEHAAPSREGQASLSDVVRWFKTMSTNAYIRGVHESGWAEFDGKLWQRSFHDHIIRDEPGLLKIRQYIQENPARWAEDTFYRENRS